MPSPAWVGASVTAKSAIMPYTYKSTRLVIEEGLDKHEVYRLVLMGIENPTVHPALQSGAPLLIQCASQGTQRYLYAYVVKVEQRPTGKLAPVYEVLCVGATKPLKATAVGTFPRRTVTSIVQQQCEKYGIAVLGSLDDTVWTDLSPIDGESEWQHIVRIVHQAGGSLCTYGAAVQLIDMAQPWNSSPRPPTLNQGTITPHISNVGIAGGTEAALYEATFNGTTVSQPEPDPILGSGRTGTQLPTRRITDTFPSLGETMAALRATSVLSAYTHTATLRIVGQLNMCCGTVVRLALTDPIVSAYNGLWLISGAKHEIVSKTGEYVTTLQLLKDSFGLTTPSVVQRAGASLARNVNVQTVWRNQQWTAIGRAA